MPEISKHPPTEKMTVAVIKGSQVYFAWFSRLREHTRLPAAILLDAALVAYAKALGFDCRFRSDSASLFRSRERHLGGCGVNHRRSVSEWRRAAGTAARPSAGRVEDAGEVKGDGTKGVVRRARRLVGHGGRGRSGRSA